MIRRRPATGRILSAATALTLLLAVPALLPPVSAAPAAGAATGQQWAYGAVKIVNASGTSPNGTYSAHAFFGYHVIFSQTNTSATVSLLELERTMASNITVTYCQPDCTTPLTTASISLRAQETDTGFANVTTQANVTVGGVPVSAVGIVNSSSSVAGRIDDTFSATLHGPMATHVASGSLEVLESAQLALAFQPALGLAPSTLTTGEVWNSTAHYTGVGAWEANYSHARTLVNGSGVSGASNVSGDASGSGVVSVSGTDLGPVDLAGGVRVPAIALGIAGPFHLREGLLFLPGDSDLFASSSAPWASSAFGGADIQLADLDLAPVQSGHFGLVASSTSFSSTSTSLDASPVGAAPMASGNGGTPPVIVQGQPEPVPAAQQGSQCLTVGTCTSPTVGGGTANPTRTGGLLVLAVAVVAVVALSAVVVARRRPLDSPPSPTRSLYSPGAAHSASPPGARTAPGSPRNGGVPGAPPDDPLDHLW